MKHHQSVTPVPAGETTSDGITDRTKLVLVATPELMHLCRSLFLTTLGRVSETERRYVYDVSLGRYQTVDLSRVALLARRSTRQANRQVLVSYVRRMAEDEAKPALPLDRALLRKTHEEGEANTAVERFRYQRCLPSLDAAIEEVDDLDAALDELKTSLVAERAALSA